MLVIRLISKLEPPYYRPPLPNDCVDVNPDLIELMQCCWDEDPYERPSFDFVWSVLQHINNGA